MPDIHMQRSHQLGLPAARTIAHEWAQQLEEKYGATCRYAQSPESADGDGVDSLHFSRSGLNGTLQVSASSMVLDAKLGFLLAAFKEKIEAEIARKLDAVLGPAL